MLKIISRWEEQNVNNLQKLNSVIRRIIDTVQKPITKKCRVKGEKSGKLEILELDIKSALPDDSRLKLGNIKGLEDETKAGT